MKQTSIHKLITAAAWLAVMTIVYATLSKVDFVYQIYFKLAPFLRQPEMQTYAHYEHVVAFALLGALFALAYPERLLMVCCIVIGGAALLELAQTLTLDRHATLIDAIEKMGGGAAGILLARKIRHLLRKGISAWTKSDIDAG